MLLNYTYEKANKVFTLWLPKAFLRPINREIFDSLFEAKVLVERWRKEYNQIRPHSSLGYRPPAPKAIYPQIQQFDKSIIN